jgi:hypothetical protein
MIKFRAKIVQVEEKTRAVWRSGLGKEAVFDKVSEGWWVTLDAGISLWVGSTKPDLVRGESVTISLDRGER